MLILSRKIDDSIVIGDNINITVLGVNRNQVRIGIDAPGSIKIYRDELFKKKFRKKVNSSAKENSKDRCEDEKKK